jgi:hypothetical protein
MIREILGTGSLYPLVRTSKKTRHSSITNINWLMLFKKVIAVYSDNNIDHINKHFWQYSQLLFVIAGGTYSYHCP